MRAGRVTRQADLRRVARELDQPQAAGPRMALAVLRSLATTSRLACLARRFSSTVFPVFCDRLALATATTSLVARADALCATLERPDLGSDACRGCADQERPPTGRSPPRRHGTPRPLAAHVAGPARAGACRPGERRGGTEG